MGKQVVDIYINRKDIKMFVVVCLIIIGVLLYSGTKTKGYQAEKMKERLKKDVENKNNQ